MWNWQHKSWPQFRYDKETFQGLETQFIEQAGVLLGSMKHVDEQEKDTLKVELISNEAYKTSEIEGELLSRDSLQSSIRKQFGLKTDNRKIPPAEYGIAEMMVDLYANYASALTHDRLFLWHKMLTNGRRDLLEIGNYRTHDEPMQIVSGPLNRPRIHFEAPPSHRVPNEMQAFIDWFNQSGPQGGSPLPALQRAGIAHLYFESIHPFKDGNGRIGRAISEKAVKRIFQEGLNGFQGGLSAKNYISITGATRATATRDLQTLVEQGIFLKTGELKSTRYHLNMVF